MENADKLEYDNLKFGVVEVLKSIKKRKNTILVHIFLLTAPTLIVLILVQVLGSGLMDSLVDYGYYYLFGVGIFVIYIICVQTIFDIEKALWIDAYFDNKQITSVESFNIARKLFWPAAKVHVYIGMKYLVLPLLLYIVIMAINLVVWDNFFILSVMFIGVWAFPFAFMHLRVKFRYLDFVILDFYGTEQYSIKSIMEEIDRLNNVKKDEAYIAALTASLGADFISITTQTAVSFSFAQLANIIGGWGGVFLQYADEYLKTLVGQVKDIILLSFYYVMYKSSREFLYKTPQKINERVYDLAK